MATQYNAGLTSGQVLTAATMNSIGAAWETWTPAVTQSGAVTATTTYAKYMRIQKLVIASAYMSITGTGTANNAVEMSLPITAASSSAQIIGSGIIFDDSATKVYVVSAAIYSTTKAIFYADQMGTGGVWGVDPNLALANADQVRVLLTYEAA